MQDGSDISSDLNSYGWTVNTVHADLGLGEAKTTLVGYMNESAALVSYVGHSSQYEWNTWDAPLFRFGDAQMLANSGKPMVVAQYGCWNSYYLTPWYNTLPIVSYYPVIVAPQPY